MFNIMQCEYTAVPAKFNSEKSCADGVVRNTCGRMYDDSIAARVCKEAPN